VKPQLNTQRKTDYSQIEALARDIRLKVIEVMRNTGSGHIGTCLSIAEILAVLYTQVLHHDPKRPDWSERDYFILSEGHGAIALYAILAEVGFFEPTELANYKANGSIFSPMASARVPGVELTTGSLGQGLGYAAGLALGFKLRNRSNRVFCLIGDGENDEGAIWEAAQFAGRKHLNNLCLIINRNHQKSSAIIKDLTDYETIYQGLGFEVKTIDGHNPAEIIAAFNSQSANSTANADQPLCIIAETVKGKGVSFAERAADNHNRPISPEEYQLARSEILQSSVRNNQISDAHSLNKATPLPSFPKIQN
jgi:transketolase